MAMQVDYSLYLVTDSTEAILGKRNLVDVVELAILGGVTIVQYRDKTSDTGTLIKTAKALHAKCKAHNVPLVINDRIDVAQAIDCEGVHLGQDDTPISTARKILGLTKIIGATVSSIEEARIAVELGADYLGIGTLYATNTKKNTKEIIGVNGIRRILRYLDESGEKARGTKTVCIGGVNGSNAQRIMHQLYAPSPTKREPKTIDGVAVVSAIIAPSDPRAAASDLKSLVTTPPPFARHALSPSSIATSTSPLLTALKAVHQEHPISHNMTNLVVQNFAANVALCIGASPIMSNNGLEAPDLAKLGGGLVINMGTATPDALKNHRQAIQAYNAVGSPVILDPVGAGATSARKDALQFLMESGYFDLIKGNESEILAVARASGLRINLEARQQRGVDSGTSSLTPSQKASLVQHIALRERTVVLLTGATDILSNGHTTLAISNGHAFLGMITGSGCTVGTTLSAYLAANREGKFEAALAGLCHYEIAAEDAAKREDVKGPGTFVPAFLDELYKGRMDVVEDRGEEWVKRVKVEMLEVGDGADFVTEA
ncbi:TMP-TENI-domain-containing protein [Massarina eburnea CBS 473.64]|uniref:TMP-TENI-domain-containing protein n=1 Tax=Massarina eburnea CBS 473.64 TaxID=1395130 RepID=A0A6A6RSZ9_9PLEO|nr:TMP-TENI-domain-containing protein [Massarina eburnea CBS 473.64]